MNAASQKCNQPTLWDMSSTTSSPESVDGALPCVLQGGLPIGESGQAPAPASRSVQRGSGKAKKTKDTSGQSGLSCSEGTTLSASESLSLSLVNRLRQRLGTAGSMEYAQTWKQKATPLGMRYWEHTALGHRTSGSDCTGWVSPTAGDAKGVAYRRDGGQKTENMTGTSLQQVAALSGWSTPRTTVRGPEPVEKRRARGAGGASLEDQVAGWATPTVRDYRSESASAEFNQKRWSHPRGKPLSAEATLAGWDSPTVADADKTTARSKQGIPRQLPFGITSTSSPAETEKRGVLAVDFVAWLMGYPASWSDCYRSSLANQKRR